MALQLQLLLVQRRLRYKHQKRLPRSPPPPSPPPPDHPHRLFREMSETGREIEEIKRGT